MKRMALLAIALLALAIIPARADPDEPPRVCDHVLACDEWGCSQPEYTLKLLLTGGYLVDEERVESGCSAAVVVEGEPYYTDFGIVVWPGETATWPGLCRAVGPCRVCNLNPHIWHSPVTVTCPGEIVPDAIYLNFKRRVIPMEMFLPVVLRDAGRSGRMAPPTPHVLPTPHVTPTGAP